MRLGLVTLGLVAAAVAAVPAGAQDVQVAGLQVALRARGVDPGGVDGVRGPRTVAAVRAFQRRAGLPPDGVVGPRTRRALGRLGRPLFGRRTIVRGAVGWDVSVLQFLLRRRGLRPGTLDGRFGAATARAVRSFQGRTGLAPDGIVGPATMAALQGRAVLVLAPTTTHAAAQRYVVRRGDTLTALAARFGTTVTALARANRLDARGVLREGAALRIPAARRSSPAHADVRALLNRWATHYGVDARLVRALAWQESGYQQRVVSSAGALGVMQVTPATWDFVETVLLGRSVARTADGNVRVGVAFLRHLLRVFRGSERLAVGAYYQGPRSVRRHGLFRETRRYVANVLALKSRV